MIQEKMELEGQMFLLEKLQGEVIEYDPTIGQQINYSDCDGEVDPIPDMYTDQQL